MSQELPVVKGQRGTGRARADIGIWPTKEEFEDALIFARNETLRMGESSFLQIVLLLEKYNLSDNP